MATFPDEKYFRSCFDVTILAAVSPATGGRLTGPF